MTNRNPFLVKNGTYKHNLLKINMFWLVYSFYNQSYDDRTVIGVCITKEQAIELYNKMTMSTSYSNRMFSYYVTQVITNEFGMVTNETLVEV